MNSDGIDQVQGNDDPYVLKISFLSYPDEVLTPLLRSYADVVQDSSHRSTLGFSFSTKSIKVDDNFIKLILLDISTKPYFGSISSSHFSGSAAAVFAFSKSNDRFFNSTKELFHKLKRDNPNFPRLLIFIGVLDKSEVVTTAQGQELTHELGGAYDEMTPDDLQTFDSIVQFLSLEWLLKMDELIFESVLYTHLRSGKDLRDRSVKEHLRRFLDTNLQHLDNLSEYFSQIESNAAVIVSKSLRNQWDPHLLIASLDYWKAFRELAKSGKTQSTTLRDPQKLITFLTNAQETLSEFVPEEKNVP